MILSVFLLFKTSEELRRQEKMLQSVYCSEGGVPEVNIPRLAATGAAANWKALLEMKAVKLGCLKNLSRSAIFWHNGSPS